eukprot:1183543-Amphidinium_carterae.1
MKPDLQCLHSARLQVWPPHRQLPRGYLLEVPGVAPSSSQSSCRANILCTISIQLDLDVKTRSMNGQFVMTIAPPSPQEVLRRAERAPPRLLPLRVASE